MCTCISFKTTDHYFGRNLDMEFSYGEKVMITPRNFQLNFRYNKEFENHYSIIGIGIETDGFPLYFDAANEKGLSAAALNFPLFSHYFDVDINKTNVASFEIIPWVLCQCETVDETKKLLSQANIVNTPFNESFPPSPLHWMISDKESSLVIESTNNGFRLTDNPVGVLTNSPPFEMQLFNLNNYMNLSSEIVKNRFSDKVCLQAYSRGMGAIGMPGDLSSSSRFVRAVFTKYNSVCNACEEESVSQFFHILGSVAQQKGCAQVEDKKYEYTVYSSCCNADKGIYYYTTYENPQINAIFLNNENLESDELILYSLNREMKINKTHNRI